MGKFQGAGGTPGGLGEFVIGLAMSLTGAYLILERVTVSSDFYLPWFGGGRNTFGPVFSLLLLGLFIVFFDGRSRLGWLMTLGGLLLILWGIISSLHVYFRDTSLIGAVVMFGLLAGGLGLVLRAVQPHGEP